MTSLCLLLAGPSASFAAGATPPADEHADSRPASKPATEAQSEAGEAAAQKIQDHYEAALKHCKELTGNVRAACIAEAKLKYGQ